MKRVKKWLTILLSAAMLCSCAETCVFAENVEVTETEVYAAEENFDTVELAEIDDEIFAETENSKPGLNDEELEAALMSVETTLSGSGTEQSPYLVTSESDLLEMAESNNSAFLNAHFSLQNDISLTAENWKPIGSNSCNFKGTFDGNGHIISNVKITEIENANGYAGLFGRVDGGVIKNLGVQTEMTVDKTAGALVGWAEGGAEIAYCYSSGSITCTGSSNDTGGLVGYISRGTVHDCFSTVSVTNNNAGSSSYGAGGLIGKSYAYYGDCVIKNCYAAGKINAKHSKGLVGTTSTYGSSKNNILCSYYDLNTTEYSGNHIDGGFAMTTAAMKDKSKQNTTYTGWDFENVWEMKEGGYPTLKLPVTKTKEPIILTGTGSVENPYIITNEEELLSVVYGEQVDNFNACYRLDADIEVHSDYWTPIGGNGRSAFNGVFDGNGHTVSGIKLSQYAFENSGLFGEVTGTVKNLGVNVSISGCGVSGGLAGNIKDGTVEYCRVDGSVSASGGEAGNSIYIGGLAGRIENTLVHDSYSLASVSNISGGVYCYAGGLVGYMYDYATRNTLKDCYAAGAVSGAAEKNYTGGLVGNLLSSSSGIIGIVSCYYDSAKTGQIDSGKGFAVFSTSNMKKQDTYTGWDFENVWEIDSEKNNGYPSLRQNAHEKTKIELEGAGTENDPFIITNKAELLALARGELGARCFTACYRLEEDIDVGTEYWTPIGGNCQADFSGVFDGNGHKVTGIGLSQNAFKYTGFFGKLTGTVKNLCVDVNISGAGTAGAIAGCVDNGKIEYCGSSGPVSSSSENAGSAVYTGGLAGIIDHTTYIHDSYSLSSVSNIPATSSYSYAGGIVGRIDRSDCKVKNCYTAGVLSAKQTEGICGSLSGSTSGGKNSKNIICSYYDASKAGNAIIGYGFAVPSASKMKIKDTYTGWDFENIWDIDEGYPVLRLPVTAEEKEVVPAGSGTEDDPYIIKNEEELLAVARGEIGVGNFAYCYKLLNDIIVTTEYWTPIGGNGQEAFSGVFDGNGHIISGVNLSQEAFEYTGLFGEVTGTVKNLGVNAKISGAGTAGAIAGYLNGGTLEFCWSTGSAASTKSGCYTGGLAGRMDNANINNCYSLAAVTNTNGNGTGGLVGYMYAGTSSNCKITNCYATGAVTGKAGSSSTGGLVGNKSGSGTEVTSCYFDNYDSGDKNIGSFVSEEEMKKQNTFTNWDFSSVWTIGNDTNNGYPYLKKVSAVLPVIEVTGIKLDKDSISLEIGDVDVLAETITPVNASNKNVKWISSDTEVASVNNGIVTGIKSGTAVISAVTEDGSHTAECTVTVLDKVNNYPYKITAISIETENGETLTEFPSDRGFIVNTEIVEKQERAAKDYLLIAVYDTDNSLLSMNYVKTDFIQEQTFNVGVNIQAQQKPIGKVKAFVWSDFGGVKPLSDSAEITYSEEENIDDLPNV